LVHHTDLPRIDPPASMRYIHRAIVLAVNMMGDYYSARTGGI